MTPAQSAPGFRITGWHVLAAVVTFFAVVVAVDMAFLVTAYRTYPGEVSVTPYEDGLAHNRFVARQKAQAALGWNATAAVEGATVAVEFRDRAGAPLQGLRLAGALRRPATEAGKIALAFTEAAPGRYVAAARPAAGAWDLQILARGGQTQSFEAERRLTWP
jgi:nitrogen fixation protein FixH